MHCWENWHLGMKIFFYRVATTIFKLHYKKWCFGDNGGGDTIILWSKDRIKQIRLRFHDSGAEIVLGKKMPSDFISVLALLRIIL